MKTTFTHLTLVLSTTLFSYEALAQNNKICTTTQRGELCGEISFIQDSSTTHQKFELSQITLKKEGGAAKRVRPLQFLPGQLCRKLGTEAFANLQTGLIYNKIKHVFGTLTTENIDGEVNCTFQRGGMYGKGAWVMNGTIITVLKSIECKAYDLGKGGAQQDSQDQTDDQKLSENLGDEK
jgi:hypothetical protein